MARTFFRHRRSRRPYIIGGIDPERRKGQRLGPFAAPPPRSEQPASRPSAGPSSHRSRKLGPESTRAWAPGTISATTSFMNMPVCLLDALGADDQRQGLRVGLIVVSTSRTACAGTARMTASWPASSTSSGCRRDHMPTSWPGSPCHMGQRRPQAPLPATTIRRSCLGPQLARAIDGRLSLIQRPAGARGNAQIVSQAQGQSFGPGPGDHGGIVGAQAGWRHDEFEAVAAGCMAQNIVSTSRWRRRRPPRSGPGSLTFRMARRGTIATAMFRRSAMVSATAVSKLAQTSAMS